MSELAALLVPRVIEARCLCDLVDRILRSGQKMPAVLGPDVRGIREVVSLLEANDLLRIALLQERMMFELTEGLRDL